MQFELSVDERRRARHLHEVLLFNLITNHVLFFIALLGMFRTFPALLALVPGISFGILGYLLWQAHRARTAEPPFVAGHFRIAARRGLLFVAVQAAVLAAFGAIWLASGGHLRPIHYAIAGTSTLPLMAALLTIVMMEHESLQQATTGLLPDTALPAMAHAAAIQE